MVLDVATSAAACINVDSNHSERCFAVMVRRDAVKLGPKVKHGSRQHVVHFAAAPKLATSRVSSSGVVGFAAIEVRALAAGVVVPQLPLVAERSHVIFRAPDSLIPAREFGIGRPRHWYVRLPH